MSRRFREPALREQTIQDMTFRGLSEEAREADAACERVVLTATPLVNAIPSVCAVAGGALSALDLPLVTGRGLMS